MAMALQNGLGLCGVEESIHRCKLIGQWTGHVVFRSHHSWRTRPSLHKVT